MKEKLIELLNSPEPNERLDALDRLAQMYRTGALEPPESVVNVNNHIHTTYSFSPYSPAKAVYLAWASGLATAGIIDHDSVGGVDEFIRAGKIIGLPVTVGFECRCSFADTPFEGRSLNNPDQKSIAYVTMHAIPHQMLDEAERFLLPYREKRNIRNRKMTKNLDLMIKPYGLSLDFETDVLPLSKHNSGGSVTERHILYALAARLTEKEMPRHFLLNQFKSQLIDSVYVDAADELPHISEFISLAEKLGAVSAYAYLGDVGVSVTGDKKTQAFEDSYLDELVAYLAKIGMRAATYMPARNTAGQLENIMSLCEANGLFQISGEDVNSPLQSFVCEKIVTPGFRHLIDSAWALIGHEIAASQDLSAGMFSHKTETDMPKLSDRIRHFANLARRSIATII